MTTSGITIADMQRDDIIHAALRKLGVMAAGQQPSSEELTDGVEALNNLVAQFQTMGMPLWAKKSTVVPMVASQSTYTIGIGKTNNFAFPLKILQAWTEPVIGGGRQPLMELGIYDFNILPANQTANGTPSQFTYQPYINYGELRLWPTPDATTVANRVLTINYQAPFEIFNSSTDTSYFPREWNNALIYGLADLMSGEYGLPLNDRSQMSQLAQKHLNVALDFGLEEAPVTFAPQPRWR
jgi:hypothetical protein